MAEPFSRVSPDPVIHWIPYMFPVIIPEVSSAYCYLSVTVYKLVSHFVMQCSFHSTEVFKSYNGRKTFHIVGQQYTAVLSVKSGLNWAMSKIKQKC